jgi:MbtH protein
MTNPFEDEESDYLVLRNDEGQHSLWPGHIGIPAGWTTVHGPDARASCVAYVENHWTDMRPNSLAAFMERP